MDLQNSNLRTLAVIEAQMTKGLGRPTEYLIPFFQAAISARAGTPFVIRDILATIEKDYSLEIPVYMADSILPILEKVGAISKDSNIGGYLCKEIGENEGDTGLSQSHFDLLEGKLNRFAISLEFEKPIASDTWQHALLNFFSKKELGNKVGNIRGKLVSNPKEKDDWLVSKFIVEMQIVDPAVFDLIKRIYAAYSIADTLASIQHFGHTEDWEGLNVVYDTAVLMRLLGTSGKFLKDATLQMHNLLLDVGCNTYYFDSNLAELFQNIEALTARHLSGESIHRETAQALENGEISLGEINLLKGSADTRLGQLNITQLELPERSSNMQAQINPAELESFLKEKINYRRNTFAAQVDAESIERVIFLRGAKKYSELPKSKYVFVTHNYNYAKHSANFCKEYCGYQKQHVSPVVTLNTLTRLSWLASENGGKPLDLSNELIINCFQASLPDDKWFGKFWNAIENTNPEYLNTDAHESLYLLDIRKAVEDMSIGSSALIDDLDISKVIENARKAADERKLKHQNEIDERDKAAELSFKNHIEEKKIIEREAEREKLAIENKAEQEREKLKIEFEEITHNKVNELTVNLEEKHKKMVSEAVQENESKILTAIEAKARRHASRLSKAISIFLALIFGYLFFLSLQTELPAWIASEYSGYIKGISGFLGIMQVLGLFIPKCSFLFLGPKMESALSTVLVKRYMTLVEV